MTGVKIGLNPRGPFRNKQVRPPPIECGGSGELQLPSHREGEPPRGWPMISAARRRKHRARFFASGWLCQTRGPALTALLGGSVQALASAPGTPKRHVDDGSMRVLAIGVGSGSRAFPICRPSGNSATGMSSSKLGRTVRAKLIAGADHDAVARGDGGRRSRSPAACGKRGQQVQVDRVGCKCAACADRALGARVPLWQRRRAANANSRESSCSA